MKATETKQLKEAIEVMKACFTQAEVMAERAKEREEWQQILNRLEKLVEPLELYESVWVNKADDLTDRQRETYRGEVIEDVARKYEDVVDNLKNMIHDIEYLLETDI